jgi:protocatechuate 3,4-dioxygenase beta subunit
MPRRHSIFLLIVAVLWALSEGAGAAPAADQSTAGASTAQIALAGRVIDSQDRPVEGATVTLYQMTPDVTASSPKIETVQEKITGADGQYSFTLAPGIGPYWARFLVVRKEGLALGWGVWRKPADQRLDIVLGEPKDLAGHVVDEQGQPIAEAQVDIVLAMMGKAQDRHLLAAPSLFNTKTDSQGRFLFTNMPAEATFEFSVRKSGRVTLSTFARVIFGDSSGEMDIAQVLSGNIRYQFSPSQTDIRLVLPQEARIEGLVIEKTSGKLISGVKVTTRSDQMRHGFVSPDPVPTAEDGTFRIGGLAAGRHTVQLAMARGAVAEWVVEPVEVDLRADETKTGIRLELMKGGTIEVLVRDAAGQPLAKTNVRIHHTQRDQSYYGGTDTNGLARIRVPPGQYRVSEPFRPGYLLRMRDEHVAIADGQTKRVEFTLGVRPKVSGTVRDEAGKPLAGVRIQVMPSVGEAATTDADGKFALSWDSGLGKRDGATFVLMARDPGRNLAETVEINEQMDTLDLRLKPGTILMGTVVNHEGKPLPGAQIFVDLRDLDGSGLWGRIEQATTGEDGTFEVQAIPVGRQYEVTATAKGYGTQDVSLHASRLTPDRQDVGQFKLPLADLSISGIVVDEEGKPVADATVHIFDGSLPRHGEVRTDAEGKFTIQGVPAGPSLLVARTRGPTYLHGSIRANGGATGARIVVSK